jgi:hypothetical protein
MQTLLSCYNCLLQQAVEALESSKVSFDIQIRTVKKVLLILASADPSLSPPELSGRINEVIRDALGNEYLYADMKQKSHQIAMEYFEDLKKISHQSEDPIEQGLKISAVGNLVDVIHANEYHLWEEVETALQQDLLGGGLEAFRNRLCEAPYLLYLADNVGETVFDRVFIEMLDLPVIYAVKGGPILNDATLEDARKAGIDRFAEVVETGSRSPGTVLRQCTEEFQDLFLKSELILAKGQANFETLEGQYKNVFFLFRVKCPLLGKEIDAPTGSLILAQAAP